MPALRERVTSLVEDVGLGSGHRRRADRLLKRLSPDSYTSLYTVLRDATRSTDRKWASEAVAYRLQRLEQLFRYVKARGLHDDFRGVLVDFWSDRLREGSSFEPLAARRALGALAEHLRKWEADPKPFRASFAFALVHDAFRLFPKETPRAVKLAGGRKHPLFPLHVYSTAVALRISGLEQLRRSREKSDDPWWASTHAIIHQQGSLDKEERESTSETLRSLETLRENMRRHYKRELEQL
jgi:hypothetical protein